ncbi:hypothetical protein ALT1644_230021 [Alteromonas macleodii]|jgi:DnaK suppressor protein|uniref:hypothetical protein n=1 Tax=Alteromonas TaxID=226 RepID=UPI0021CC753B|nr:MULTISPECIES: hypothetical protein [Alteromonas]MEC9334797.1 hypothetical protein [Pseudomonadota bacterium]MEC9478769.1 hypothetical protein [Pseudomonadota bacterium]|tara:strand:+ start:2658 stop:2849 length:192 start_codon:yes stop_codon:yes gene_type:complete
MSKTLTKESLLAASEDDYMNDEQLEFFQALLNDLKQQTMAHIEEMKAESSIITHKESNDTFCA